jgi:hypothetical protein
MGGPLQSYPIFMVGVFVEVRAQGPRGRVSTSSFSLGGEEDKEELI